MSTSDNQEEQPENISDTTEENQSTLSIVIKALIRLGICLIAVILIGWMGANLVYLTRIDLDQFLPTDVDKKPYTDVSIERDVSPNQTGNVEGGACGVPIDFTKSSIYTKLLGKSMFDYGYPYNTNTSDHTISCFINAWISNKVKYSNIWLRSFIKSVVNIFESTCLILPESMLDILSFIIGPIVIPIIIGVVSTFWWIANLISFILNEDQGWKGFLTTIFCFFPTMILLFILHFVQIFEVMFKLTLLPVLLNPSKIMEIMDRKYNSFYMLLLFILGAIIINLPYIPSLWTIVSVIVAVISVIYISINDLPSNGQ
jgi:hypothetical protein